MEYTKIPLNKSHYYYLQPKRSILTIRTPRRRDVDTYIKASNMAQRSKRYHDTRLINNYRFALQNVDAIKKHLGLKWPIEISLIKNSSTMYYASGQYRCGRVGVVKYVPFTEKRHVIELYAYMHPTSASITLWHEATHAKQCEESGLVPGEWLEKLITDRNYSPDLMTQEEYREVPEEKEAYESAVNHFDIAKLAKNVQASNT